MAFDESVDRINKMWAKQALDDIAKDKDFVARMLNYWRYKEENKMSEFETLMKCKKFLECHNPECSHSKSHERNGGCQFSCSRAGSVCKPIKDKEEKDKEESKMAPPLEGITKRLTDRVILSAVEVEIPVAVNDVLDEYESESYIYKQYKLISPLSVLLAARDPYCKEFQEEFRRFLSVCTVRRAAFFEEIPLDRIAKRFPDPRKKIEKDQPKELTDPKPKWEKFLLDHSFITREDKPQNTEYKIGDEFISDQGSIYRFIKMFKGSAGELLGLLCMANYTVLLGSLWDVESGTHYIPMDYWDFIRDELPLNLTSRKIDGINCKSDNWANGEGKSIERGEYC